MDYEPQKTLTLDFLCDDGKHHITKLICYSLFEARSMADAVFRESHVRYVEVEIRAENGYSEILPNVYAETVEDLLRI